MKKLIYFVIPFLPLIARAQAPTGVVAKAISPTQVEVSWVDNFPNETGFVIERRRSGKENFEPMGETAANVSKFTDKAARQNAKLYYRVAAKLPSGNSPFSENAMVMTPEELPAPPSNLIAMVVSGNQINVMWTDNSKNETGFVLERKTGATGAFAKIETLSFDETDFKDKTIAAPGTYFYRVKAIIASGGSAYSNEVSAAIQPGEKKRITPAFLTRGYNEILNLQITGTSENWLLNDVAPQQLEPGYEWWYIIGGKIIKTKTNLKNEPWKGNHPGRVIKMGGKIGLDTFNKWTTNPAEQSYYFDTKAGMHMGKGTGGVATFMFR